MSVYDDIRDERMTHASKGYDAAHDLDHGLDHLISWSMLYASKGTRNELVKAAALLVAAVEYLDSEATA